jgi:anti-sigma factor RsiW
MRLLFRKDLQCQQAVELVTDYLEGALSRRERRRFEVHIRSCPNCSAYLEQIQAVIATSGSITPDDLSPQARDDLTALYRRWQGDDPEAEEERT